MWVRPQSVSNVHEMYAKNLCVKPKIRQRRLETSDEIFGHVIRGPEGIEKLMVMGITKGKRTAGRVLTRWTDIFRKRTGLLFVESVRQSEDRSPPV